MNPLIMNKTGYIPGHHPNSPTTEVASAPEGSSTTYVAQIDGLPIFMQGQRPTCGSHGVAFAKMQYDLKHTGQFKVLSRRFLHALSKQPGQVPGDGRSIDSIIAVAEKYGIPEESVWPEPDASMSDAEYEDITQIPQSAYDNALLHKIGSHAFLKDLSIQGLYNAVIAHDIAIIGMDISSAWWTDVNGNVTWAADSILPLRPGYDGSRHCIDIYSVNVSQGLMCPMNWWSDQWGLKGVGFFTIADNQFIYEAAVITS